MKKITFSLLLLLFTALAFSCSLPDEEKTTPSKPDTKRSRAWICLYCNKYFFTISGQQPDLGGCKSRWSPGGLHKFMIAPIPGR